MRIHLTATRVLLLVGCAASRVGVGLVRSGSQDEDCTWLLL